MRAGLLRDVAIFKEPNKVKTATGAVSKEYVPIFRCRAAKKKLSNTTDKDKVDANEEFYGSVGVIQVRYSPKIKDTQIVEFRGVNYKILSPLDYQYVDNTYLVNISKINE